MLGRLLGLLEADGPPHEDDRDLWRALRNGTRRSIDDANATALVEFVRRVHSIPTRVVVVEAVGAHAPRLAAVLEANNETRAFRRAERLNATEETLEEETTETFEKNGAATGRRKSPTSGVAPQ